MISSTLSASKVAGMMTDQTRVLGGVRGFQNTFRIYIKFIIIFQNTFRIY